MNKPLCALVLTALFITTLSTAAAAGEDTHTLTGDSTVVMPDDEPDEPVEIPEIIKVILPASEAFDFVLDPQGLSGLKEGESIALDELDAGRVFSKIDIPAIVLNEGSVPIGMTVEIRATTSAGGGGNNDKAAFTETSGSLEEARAAVFDGDDHNVLLYVVPSGQGITSAHDGYIPSDFGFVITQSPITLTFTFPEAEYIMTDIDGVEVPRLIEGTGNGTQLDISGYINSNANWVNFTKDHAGDAPSTIGLVAVFNWYVIEGDDEGGEDELRQPSDSYGIRHLRGHSGGSRRRDIAPIELDEDALNTLIPNTADVKTAYMPVGGR